MKHCLSIALTLTLVFTGSARAETIACPDPAKAVQVAICPSEEELKYTFTGFCSDDRRLYARDTDTCSSYENYRKEKNVALWESADGAFQAYLSCDLPAGALKSLKPAGISVSKQGKLTRVACSYGEKVTFTYRTKAECKVRGDGNCAADPAACQADCN
jgi:hypothetical protein